MSSLSIEISSLALNAMQSCTASVNEDFVKCFNYKYTSSPVKCYLASSINEMKSISAVSYPFTSFDFSGFTTNVQFTIDANYQVSDDCTINERSKVLILNGIANWQLNSNAITSFTLHSAKIKNSNSLEVLVQPSSCLNVTLKDILLDLTLMYTATATIQLFDSNNNLVTGTNLAQSTSSIFSSNLNQEILDSQILVNIAGTLTVNTFGDHYGNVTVCN